MAASKHIYVVSEYEGTDLKADHLVKATNASQAIKFMANGLFSAHRASSLVVADLMSEGVKILDATDDAGSSNLETQNS